MKNSPHLLIPNRSVILGCFSPQDDTTLKCWGNNGGGRLGLGDISNRGDGANGPCPPSSTTVPAPRVLTLSSSCSLRAEMGTNLPSVELGAGRTAVAVSAGEGHTCALLVRLQPRGCVAGTFII